MGAEVKKNCLSCAHFDDEVYGCIITNTLLDDPEWEDKKGCDDYRTWEEVEKNCLSCKNRRHDYIWGGEKYKDFCVSAFAPLSRLVWESGEECISYKPRHLPTTTDNINHPDHYTRGGIEVMDFISAWDMNFLEGAITKYLCRYKYKGNPVEDLKKARWFLNRLIDEVEEGKWLS